MIRNKIILMCSIFHASGLEVYIACIDFSISGLTKWRIVGNWAGFEVKLTIILY